MVRLMCQNPCQRSCCDQGEQVDQIRAEKAVTALFNPEKKTMKFGTFFDENESSNDSFVTLEMAGSDVSDSEGEGQLYIDVSGNSVVEMNTNLDSNQNKDNQVVSLRKEKRRERNKRSARAYRQRRKQKLGKADQALHDLLERNSLLRQQVNQLEEEKNITMELLKKKIKIAWPYPIRVPYHPGMMSEMSVAMSTPIAMDSGVQEVTVAS